MTDYVVFVFGDSTADTMGAARDCAADLTEVARTFGVETAPLVVDRAETRAPVLLLVATHKAVEPFVVSFACAGKVSARATSRPVAVSMYRMLLELQRGHDEPGPRRRP